MASNNARLEARLASSASAESRQKLGRAVASIEEVAGIKILEDGHPMDHFRERAGEELGMSLVRKLSSFLNALDCLSQEHGLEMNDLVAAFFHRLMQTAAKRIGPGGKPLKVTLADLKNCSQKMEELFENGSLSEPTLDGQADLRTVLIQNIKAGAYKLANLERRTFPGLYERIQRHGVAAFASSAQPHGPQPAVSEDEEMEGPVPSVEADHPMEDLSADDDEKDEEEPERALLAASGSESLRSSQLEYVLGGSDHPRRASKSGVGDVDGDEDEDVDMDEDDESEGLRARSPPKKRRRLQRKVVPSRKELYTRPPNRGSSFPSEVLWLGSSQSSSRQMGRRPEPLQEHEESSAQAREPAFRPMSSESGFEQAVGKAIGSARSEHVPEQTEITEQASAAQHVSDEVHGRMDMLTSTMAEMKAQLLDRMREVEDSHARQLRDVQDGITALLEAGAQQQAGLDLPTVQGAVEGPQDAQAGTSGTAEVGVQTGAEGLVKYARTGASDLVEELPPAHSDEELSPSNSLDLETEDRGSQAFAASRR